MPTAREHYAARVDADSQTAPDEVRQVVVAWAARLAATRPARLLDVGCGVGGNLTLLRGALPEGTVVLGVELAWTAARTAAAVHPQVLVADAARLPLADGVVDAAVCTEVLEHVDDPTAVLAEVARVLRGGGTALVSCPCYANLAGAHKWLADRRSGRHDWNPWGAHHGGFEAFMTGRRLAGHAAAAGLAVTAVRGLDYGQALTGRFAALDRLATSRPGRAGLRRSLPPLYRSEAGWLQWHGMHTVLELRKPAPWHPPGPGEAFRRPRR